MKNNFTTDDFKVVQTIDGAFAVTVTTTFIYSKKQFAEFNITNLLDALSEVAEKSLNYSED